MKRYIIFDMDETLIHSPGLRDAFVYACGAHGIDLVAALAQWKVGRGMTLYHSLAIITGAEPHAPEHEAFVETFWQCMASFDPAPLEGAAEALERLAAEPNVHMYLSTGSHPDAAMRWLGALEWLDYFELVLGSAPGTLKGPDHYTAIIEHAGVDAETFAAQSATVGDGQYDMSYGRDHNVRLRIGLSAGDAFMAAQLTEHGATHVVDKVAEAVEIILAS